MCGTAHPSEILYSPLMYDKFCIFIL